MVASKQPGCTIAVVVHERQSSSAGVDEHGQAPEGQVRNVAEILTAFGAARAQANISYQHLLAEAQAAATALITYLGPANMQDQEMIDAFDHQHMRQRGPNVNAMILVVKGKIDAICTKSANRDAILSAFPVFEWPATR